MGIRQQAVEREGIALFGLGEGIEELAEVIRAAEDSSAVVAAVEGMVDQAVGGGSGSSADAARLASRLKDDNRK